MRKSTLVKWEVDNYDGLDIYFYNPVTAIMLFVQ